jgi:hypothetical protein
MQWFISVGSEILYYLDHLFRWRVTEGCEVNKFGTCDSDCRVVKTLFFVRWKAGKTIFELC